MSLVVYEDRCDNLTSSKHFLEDSALMAKHSNQHAEWARVGAKARLAEIEAEMASIYQAFPDLKGSRTAPSAARAKAGSVTGKRQFSTAGKNAISEGMRRYWARRKSLAAKAAKSASK